MSSTATKGGENAAPPPPPPPSAAGMNAAAAQMNPMLQAQYQQYYQYMQYYMYQPAALMAAYQQQNMPSNAVASAAMQSYYNYGQPPPAGKAPPASSSNAPASAAASARPSEKQAPIKINLKFQQHGAASAEPTDSPGSPTGSVRKSRFSHVPINNVLDQQNQYKQQQQQHQQQQRSDAARSASIAAETTNATAAKQAPASSSSSSSSTATDIVYDIQKWPAALKSYCTKVYQSFNFVKTPGVTEDQVTKYLQQRITEAFKSKPDLNIDWEHEPVPTVEMVRKAVPAPAPARPPQQQQQQANVNHAAIKAAKLAANQVMARKFPANSNQALHHQTVGNNKSYHSPAVGGGGSSSSSSRSSSSEARGKSKRKHRSRSVSSSSSRSRSSSSRSRSSRSSHSSPRSSSDQNYIALTSANKVKDNLNKKFNKATNLGQKEFGSNKKKLRKEQLQQQQQLNRRKGYNGGLVDDDEVWSSGKKNKKLKKGQQQQRQQAVARKIFADSVITPKKQYRSIFVLERELEKSSDQMDTSDLVCIGTSSDLEKEYLRLTGPPDPAMVRPLHILRRSLVHVLREYERTKNYRYICDQMKAIRQDLTVQMIRNEFTVEVYEAHARIAIRNGDRDEFNQCQSQLKSLYDLIEKNLTTPPLSSEQQQRAAANSAEFVGYRLVYNMLTKSINDQSQIIKEIKRKYSNDVYLMHLLELRQAWHLNNYVKFFKLYKKSNELTKSLMSLFIERERKNALKLIIKAYRPSIRLENVCELLAYESLDICKTDLTEKYKLSVQSIACEEGSGGGGSESTTTTTKTSTTTTTTTTTQQAAKLAAIKGGSFLIKSTGIGRTVITDNASSGGAQKTELILDCKSCNAQNL